MVAGAVAPSRATPESIPCTTPLSQQPSQFVTITHPYHPLCGQQVKVIRVCRGADPDITVLLPDGLHVVVSMSWTDYATPQGCASPSSPPHLLDFDGLRQAIQLIDRIRQEGRYPALDDEGRTWTSDDESYD